MDIFIVKNDLNTMYFDKMWVLETGTDAWLSHTWLSTGFFTVVTAFNICEEVTLFGFAQSDHCRKKKRHTKEKKNIRWQRFF